MLLANFNGKEHLRHRAVSLRQHGFLVTISLINFFIILCFVFCIDVDVKVAVPNLRAEANVFLTDRTKQ